MSQIGRGPNSGQVADKVSLAAIWHYKYYEALINTSDSHNTLVSFFACRLVGFPAHLVLPLALKCSFPPQGDVLSSDYLPGCPL